MKKIHFPMPVRYGINLVLLAAFLIVGNLILSEGLISRAHTTILKQVGFYIILAVALNLVTGCLGQLPLGHAGFMAVGAYAGAIFWKSGLLTGMPSVITGLLLAGLVAAVFGVIIGVPALRLRGDYLAIITLGFGEIIRVAIINLPKLTGGTPGLIGIPKHSTFLVVYTCVILACGLVHLVMKSRHGRAILSIRENEIAAESCGINTTYYKVMAFTLSAFLTGVAGALYGGNQAILQPNSFNYMTSINILVIVVLGGMGSMVGSVVAATVLTALPPLLQGLNEYRMIIYALLLIIVMIFKPSGLFGRYDFSLTGLLQKLFTRILGLKTPRGGKKDETQ